MKWSEEGFTRKDGWMIGRSVIALLLAGLGFWCINQPDPEYLTTDGLDVVVAEDGQYVTWTDDDTLTWYSPIYTTDKEPDVVYVEMGENDIRLDDLIKYWEAGHGTD